MTTHTDPLFKVYERALKALHGGKMEEAARQFERVVEEADQADLALRARQHLEIARQRGAARPKQAEPADPFLLAVVARNDGRLDEALALCEQEGRRKRDERFAHLAAAVLALKGKKKEAAEQLALAIELNPKNRVHAFHDSDFADLRRDPEYTHLFRR